MTDKMKVRMLLMPFTMTIVTGNFFLLSILSSDALIHLYLLIFLTGILISGPHSLLAGPYATDLGHEFKVKYGRDAVSTVAGIIDGFGSVVCAFSMMVIPMYEDEFFSLLACKPDFISIAGPSCL